MWIFLWLQTLSVARTTLEKAVFYKRQKPRQESIKVKIAKDAQLSMRQDVLLVKKERLKRLK